MNQINQITDYAGQTMTMILADGTSFTMTLVYKTLQFGWFIQSLTYKNLTIKGIRICLGVNILRQFKNQIPFGLGCACQGNREPTQQTDFSTNAAQLFVLTQTEVDEYEDFLNGT